MIELQVTANGEVEMHRRLMVSSELIKDFRAPLAEAASELQKSFQLNFDQRGSLFGGWNPRTKSYPWPLLEKSGAMRKSFYSSIGENVAVLGNTASYFKYHQLGTQKMPQRLMMKIDTARKVIVVKIFQAHIMAAIRGGK